MYIVNIEKVSLIDRIELPVLIVRKDSTYDVKFGSEITTASMEEVVFLKKDIQDWLDINVIGNYKLVQSKLHFENEEEAIHFKTVWI